MYSNTNTNTNTYMLFFGGQYGKMGAILCALNRTVKKVVPVSVEVETLVPYVKPTVRTLGAFEHCGKGHVLVKLEDLNLFETLQDRE